VRPVAREPSDPRFRNAKFSSVWALATPTELRYEAKVLVVDHEFGGGELPIVRNFAAAHRSVVIKTKALIARGSALPSMYPR
jgi:hypothetical protein